MWGSQSKYLVRILCFCALASISAYAETAEPTITPDQLLTLLPQVECSGLFVTFVDRNNVTQQIEITPSWSDCNRLMERFRGASKNFWPVPRVDEVMDLYYQRASHVALSLCKELIKISHTSMRNYEPAGCTIAPMLDKKLPQIFWQNLDELRDSEPFRFGPVCVHFPLQQSELANLSPILKSIFVVMEDDTSRDSVAATLSLQGFSKSFFDPNSFEWRFWVVEFNDADEVGFVPPISFRFNFGKKQTYGWSRACSLDPTGDLCKMEQAYLKSPAIAGLCLSVEGIGP